MQGLIEGQAQAKKEAEKAGTECGILSGTSNVSCYTLCPFFPDGWGWNVEKADADARYIWP